MLIYLWVESGEPIAGRAGVDDGEVLEFVGWLGLLRVLSELVSAPDP